MRIALAALLVCCCMAFTCNVRAQGISQHACVGFRVEIDTRTGIPRDLIAAICRYYESEQRRDWNATYRIRPRDFQSLVSFDLYEREMSKATQPGLALSLLRVRVSPAARSHEVRLAMDFCRGPGALQTPVDPSASSCILRDFAEWLHEDGEWKCAGCGEELLYPYNGRMVFPD